ncbi:MAG: hypothetical protein NZ992_05985 [Candidatus Korarchaeum sp.]|nr:hypothetical protein [Candidatus Korarchaeum sp.]MDW8035703.1 inositol monophosphatase family protein [Candidatus Korarchaeum sp.]
MVTLKDLTELSFRIKDRVSEYLGCDIELDYLSEGGDTARAIDEAAKLEIEQWTSESKRPSIISEENGLIEGEEDGVIFLDPIDGSSNADRGIPFACVSIAYSKSSSLKDLSISVILNIFSGDLYYAERGRGSYKNGVKISVRDFRGTPVIYAPCQEIDPLRNLDLKHISRRDYGSVALGLALISEGKVDVLLNSNEDLRAVDIAAGLLLVKESGGSVFLNKLEVHGLKRELGIVAGVEILSSKLAPRNYLRL